MGRKRKLVILLGSPRKRGNSATLAGAAAAAAKKARADVESVYINGLDIRACQGCDGCQRKGGRGCVQNDDMRSLYPKLLAADALLFAGPVYWFNVSAQTKLFLDRLYALGSSRGHALKGKRIGLILTYADADPFRSGAVNALRTFQDAFAYIGAGIVGMVFGSAWKAGEVRRNAKLMGEARALGRDLCA